MALERIVALFGFGRQPGRAPLPLLPQGPCPGGQDSGHLACLGFGEVPGALRTLHGPREAGTGSGVSLLGGGPRGNSSEPSILSACSDVCLLCPGVLPAGVLSSPKPAGWLVPVDNSCGIRLIHRIGIGFYTRLSSCFSSLGVKPVDSHNSQHWEQECAFLFGSYLHLGGGLRRGLTSVGHLDLCPATRRGRDPCSPNTLPASLASAPRPGWCPQHD